MSAAARRLKRALKPAYNRARAGLVRAFRSYGAVELASTLREMGVTPGECLFVHGRFDRLNGFQGSAGECLDCLLGAVGEGGHLLMPSMAYRGASERYARSGVVFDVRRTPSSMGMLSEVFRRRPAVERSLSALHPVLAHGPKARWLVADHDRLRHSCGPGSPFERFRHLGGKVLFLNTTFNTLTFMHYLEHVCAQCFPFDIYAPHAIPITVRDREGREREVTQALFSEALRARRTFDGVKRALAESGQLVLRRLGNSDLMLADVAHIHDKGLEVAALGAGGLYD